MTALPRRAVLGAGLSLLPLLAGCGGLLPSPPERQLYRLAPQLVFRTRLPQVAAQLLVATPSAPGALDTRRIALSRTPVSLDYFAGAEWSDRPAFLVRSALIEGFENSRTFAGIGSESAGLQADYVLNSEIREFTAIYDSPNRPPQARVRLHAELIGMPERTILAETTASHAARAAANTLPAIVAAFDAALGGAVEDLVAWTAGNPVLSRRRAAVQSRTRFVHRVGGAEG